MGGRQQPKTSMLHYSCRNCIQKQLKMHMKALSITSNTYFDQILNQICLWTVAIITQSQIMRKQYHALLPSSMAMCLWWIFSNSSFLLINPATLPSKFFIFSNITALSASRSIFFWYNFQQSIKFFSMKMLLRSLSVDFRFFSKIQFIFKLTNSFLSCSFSFSTSYTLLSILISLTNGLRYYNLMALIMVFLVENIFELLDFPFMSQMMSSSRLFQSLRCCISIYIQLILVVLKSRLRHQMVYCCAYIVLLSSSIFFLRRSTSVWLSRSILFYMNNFRTF